VPSLIVDKAQNTKTLRFCFFLVGDSGYHPFFVAQIENAMEVD
jgi:hypothetical protein